MSAPAAIILDKVPGPSKKPPSVSEPPSSPESSESDPPELVSGLRCDYRSLSDNYGENIKKQLAQLGRPVKHFVFKYNKNSIAIDAIATLGRGFFTKETDYPVVTLKHAPKSKNPFSRPDEDDDPSYEEVQEWAYKQFGGRHHHTPLAAPLGNPISTFPFLSGNFVFPTMPGDQKAKQDGQ